jgi:hypothetical protein
MTVKTFDQIAEATKSLKSELDFADFAANEYETDCAVSEAHYAEYRNRRESARRAYYAFTDSLAEYAEIAGISLEAAYNDFYEETLEEV